MNATGAIPIENRFTLESDMVNYLNQHDGYFRVYRYFTTKVNDEAGTQKFSLSRNTITFLKKSNLVTDIIHTSDISLQQMDGYVKHYLIERL